MDKAAVPRGSHFNVCGALRIRGGSGTDGGTLNLDAASDLTVEPSGFLFLDSGTVHGRVETN